MSENPERPLILHAVGDVLIERPDPPVAFEPSLDILGAADLRFGNCEGVYSSRPSRAPGASIPVLLPAENALGLGHAGFDVMSLANNHTVDGGHVGLLDTRDALHAQGILTCGAGEDLDDALRPAIVERMGRTVGFLAYSCDAVHPAGYEARDGVPGIAAIRTHTVYCRSELAAFQSGGAPDQFTVVNPVDLRRVRGQIEALRAQVDIVIVSVHAGEGAQPALLQEYEHQLAEAAIDAGADAVFGHHHHMLRGVEVRRGRPIFYGLGHFVFDVPSLESQVAPSVLRRMREHAGEYGYGPRDGYPLLPMHPDARMTAIAVCEFGADGVRAGVVPCKLNPAGQPVPLTLDSADGAEVVAYLEWLNEEAGLRARWRPGQTIGGHPMLVIVDAADEDVQVSTRGAA